jgi:hypothetical protein
MEHEGARSGRDIDPAILTSQEILQDAQRRPVEGVHVFGDVTGFEVVRDAVRWSGA